MTKHGPPKLVSQFKELQRAIIVSPQCPKNSWWRTQALKALIDEVVEERGDIDLGRLYITGLSMGGYGTWSFISRYPNTFAAAIPICGGGNPFNLPANRPPRKSGITNEFLPRGLPLAQNLPVLTFHRAQDTSVPIEETQTLVDLLELAGSSAIKITTYPDARHVQIWEIVYVNPEVWQ
ncbi:MAG: hypothetical protein HN457_18190 [Opitutales bacterium]|nr:hypothetical protein [Opitutales bacterium]MBT5167107.1 hypothetical protein [Opitutales bacterium]MBT6770306.1 hypothetical protein [Opitutales bacterium]MDG2253710.1 hypothetical protein [Opitutaceae bacterium]